jgi:uncharacterized protein YndB with AHSA1/START domain
MSKSGEYGEVLASDTIRFERLLPGPIERVWEYLTDGDKRGKWLARGPMELKPGSATALVFKHSELSAEKTPPARYKDMEGGKTMPMRILRAEAPRLLAISWAGEPGGESEVVFELTPKGDKVLLVLTHKRLANREAMKSVAGGWHTHLGVLEDNLAGRAPRGFWTSHEKLDAEYRRRLAE